MRMKKLLTFLTLLTLSIGVGWAAEAVDHLVRSITGVTAGSTSYSDWSGKTCDGGSSAVFAGNSAGGNDAIQLRSTNNSGIVSTSSGGKITKVRVNWSSNTVDGRTLNIYGSNSAYTAASNLYSTSTEGTLLGTIVKGTSTELEISGDYAYVGIRSASGAMYIGDIWFTWDTDGGTPQPTTYSITGTGATTGGTVSATATSGITSGTSVTLTATPNSGYELTAFTVDGTDVFDNMTGPDANGAYTYDITVTANVTVSATFNYIGTGTTYERVNSLSDDDIGKKFVFVCETKNAAMGTVSSYGTKVDVSNLNDGQLIITTEPVMPFTLGGSSGAWTFTNGETLLACSSDKSLTTASSSSNATSWTVSFDSNNLTMNSASVTGSKLQFNASSPRFACYSSNQTKIQLSREVATGNFTVTCDNDNIEHGSISASPSTADAGKIITITATPDAGYELSSVTVSPTESGVTAPTATINDNTATFTMPASDVTVTATFDLAWNAITYTCSPTTGGDVWVNPSDDPGFDTSSGTTKTQMGTSVTFKVVPANGFNISSVTATDASGATVNLTEGETNSSHGGWGTYYTFTMPAYAVSITATFTEGNLFIIGEANDNGWDGNTGVQMTYDTQNKVFTKDVFFSAADYGFFSFADALSGQQGSWANMGRRYGAPSGDYDILNEDNPATWDSGQQDNAFKVPAGIYNITVNKTTGQVTVTPKTVTVTLDKAAGTLEAGTTVNVVSNLNTLLQDCKSGISGTLAYSTNNGESFTDGNSFDVEEDLTAKGKAYYNKISKISDPYAYIVVTHYTVTCTANPAKGGTVSVSPTSALAGETVTITAAPKNGYDLTSITVNGDEIDITSTPYTFEMPAQATEVVATFTAKTLHLTINNDNSKGTVYGVPATSTVGSEISFTVTPKDGYAVNTVTYSFTPTGGTENTTTLTAPYSFNMPGYDVTINITYTEQSSGGGDATDLYHETFGDNPNSVRDWDDSYSVKSGVLDVYSGITGYTVVNAGQSKNTVGYNNTSGLAQRSQNSDASIIIGPLNVANYTDLELSYYWKAASIGATYYTNLYYATSADGTYTEVEGTGNGATTFVKRTYNLPQAAQVSTLYLKIVFRTSNSSAVIDEVNLAGVPVGVQAPVFTPAGGLYGIDVDVTISCPTSGATIYYTDDESNPKTSTTRKEYTGEIVVSESTTFKAYAEKGDLSSDVVTATYTINKNTEIETVQLDYLETFTGADGIGKFSIINENGYSSVWSLDGNYGVKGTAYNPNTTPTNNAATSRLVSPIIDLTAATVPELTFNHQINSYFNNPSTQCQVFIRETTDGTSGTWVQLPVTVTVPASGSWSNDFARIDLSNYIDKKIQVSFLYTNPEAGSGAGTWEIQNFKVADNTDIVVVNNIAEFMAEDVTESTIAKFRNPVVVLYHYQQYYDDEHGDYQNDYIWIKDDSGYAIVYGHYLDVEYVNGDVIPAGFTATKHKYEVGNFYQLYEPEGLQAATEKALADPEPVTLAKLNENKAAYNGHYVTISKMQIQFNKGKLVAWSTSSSGQRDFSVGDETLAIANNQAGTSGSIKGYNNFDNPWLETLNYPEYENTTTVYGDYNITGIFEKYNNTWEFMPIIITPWEPDKLTLHDLCEKGVTTENENLYIISNNLLGVYASADGTKLWVKDDTGQSICMTSPVDGDKNFEIYPEVDEDVNIPANTRLEQGHYDQSNWCEIHLTSNNASSFVGQIIKGGTIKGNFTDKLNPTLENVTLTDNDIYSEGGYALNYYMPANFKGRQKCGNATHSDSEQYYFFMNPKPQEYAQIVWAVWNSQDEKFIMSTSDYDNGHRFEGEFSIDLSMNARELLPTEITNGYGYNFKAIVRKTSSRADGFIVYPLDLDEGQDPATGINTIDVTGKAVKSVKYVNIAGMVSDVPFQGINIVVTEYTDGTRTTTKMLKK